MALDNFTSLKGIKVSLYSELEDADKILAKLKKLKDSLHGNKEAIVAISDILTDYGMMIDNIDNIYYDIPDAENVEDWKDIVIWSLPSKASVAMANDVEAALEDIKEIY